MMRALGQQVSGLGNAFVGLLIPIGVIMEVYALRLILAMHRPQQYSWGYPVGLLIGGVLLINFAQWASLLGVSAGFGGDIRASVLSYNPPSGGGNHYEVILSVTIAWIAAIGYIAIARGTYMASQLAKPGSNATSGDVATRLLFGVVCANSLGFSDVIAASLGVANKLRDYI